MKHLLLYLIILLVSLSGRAQTFTGRVVDASGTPLVATSVVAKDVAAMPDEDAYTVTFELQESKMTSFGKTIQQTGDLSGIGEIITDDLSVAERIIGPLRYLFYRNIRN
jgi:hypothetical protein